MIAYGDIDPEGALVGIFILLGIMLFAWLIQLILKLFK